MVSFQPKEPDLLHGFHADPACGDIGDATVGETEPGIGDIHLVGQNGGPGSIDILKG